MAAVTTNYVKQNVVGNERVVTASVAAMSNGDFLDTGLQQVNLASIDIVDAGATASDYISVAPATTGAPLGSGTNNGRVAFKVIGTGRAVVVEIRGN